MWITLRNCTSAMGFGKYNNLTARFFIDVVGIDEALQIEMLSFFGRTILMPGLPLGSFF